MTTRHLTPAAVKINTFWKGIILKAHPKDCRSEGSTHRPLDCKATTMCYCVNKWSRFMYILWCERWKVSSQWGIYNLVHRISVFYPCLHSRFDRFLLQFTFLSRQMRCWTRIFGMYVLDCVEAVKRLMMLGTLQCRDLLCLHHHRKSYPLLSFPSLVWSERNG